MEFFRKISHSFSIFLFLAGWLIINLWSAAFTGLAHDEAYYWVYSSDLSWGYFDHPPAVAAMIKGGYIFFQNELGVRLSNVLGMTLALLLLWRVCSRRYGRHPLLFMMLVCGLVIFHVYSFIIVPDSPLLIAMVLYFWSLEKYLKRDSFANIVLLSVAVAFMLYSKYHGFLILLFTILAYPRLVLKRSFWLTFLFSLLFYFPHIWWQVKNDLPSLRFHLFDRASGSYDISFRINFFIGVLVMSGPLVAFILWYAVLKVQINDYWEKVLLWNIWGVIAFFFLSGFSHKIEANWLLPLTVPMFFLSYKFLRTREKLKRGVVLAGLISFGATFILRLYAANDNWNYAEDYTYRLKREFHHWDEWSRQISERAGDRPVVFFNSFQYASKYRFYSGNVAHSYNTRGHRRDHFDFMEIGPRLQGKEVLLVSRNEIKGSSIITTEQGDFFATLEEDFVSYNQVGVAIDQDIDFEPNTTYHLDLTVTNNFPFALTFTEDPEQEALLVLSLYSGKGLIREKIIPIDLEQESLDPGECFVQRFNFTTPPSGSYRLDISFKSSLPEPGLNYYRSIELE